MSVRSIEPTAAGTVEPPGDTTSPRALFHEPWWLDAVAPGRWEEVVVTQGDRTTGRLPFVPSRRLGVRMLLAPPLCPRLGPLVDPGEGKYMTRLGREGEIVGRLIEQLPPHSVFRQNLRHDMLSWYPLHREGATVQPRLSYVVDGLGELDRVWSAISDKTRNTIRKAERVVTVVRDDDGDRLAAMASATFARQGLELPYGADLLQRVARVLRWTEARRSCCRPSETMDEPMPRSWWSGRPVAPTTSSGEPNPPSGRAGRAASCCGERCSRCQSSSTSSTSRDR